MIAATAARAAGGRVSAAVDAASGGPHTRRVRISLVVACGLASISVAAAQPIDPYAPAPAPAPARDVDLDTAVAAGLVARAEALVADGADGDARILVTEALAREPGPPVAEQARALLAAIDARLIKALPPTVVTPPPVEPTRPIEDLEPPPLDVDTVDGGDRRGDGRWPLGFYGALGGAAIGLAVAGGDADGDLQPVAGLAGAVVGGALGVGLARARDVDRVDAHLLGSGLVWGGVAGALFADVVSGLDDTTGTDIAVGAGVGAVGGAVLGMALRDDALTVGDAALIDAGAAVGTLVGFQLGVAMQPPESEAYTLNATVGAIAGYGAGHWLARRTDASPGRVARVLATGVVGAALPWVLYTGISDGTTDDDEQAMAWLSMAGLAGGLYLGARWTRGDAAATGVDDAPLALLRRTSAGRWSVGGPSLAPARGGGAVVPIAAGAW